MVRPPCDLMRAAIFVVLLPLSICFESSIVTSWPRRFNLLPSFSSRPRTWPALGGRERAGYRIWAPRVRAGVSRGSGSGASSTRMVESPIAGATVSDDGFVVFLSYMASGRYFEQDMYIPVVINSEDTTVVKSPEALTFLQMLQGIDMATPLLPPDALQKAYQGLYGDVGSVALTEVHMYPPINPWLGPREVSGIGSKVDGTASFSAGEARPLNAVPSAKREAMILQRAPDLVKALKHLNVIVDENRAIDLLRTFSSAEGDLDRSAFSEALAAARMPVNAAVKPPGSQASFTLVAVTDDSIGKELNVSAFVALSLHLRHKVPIVIKGGRRAPGDPQEVELNAAAWDAHAFDAADAGSLYPQWRSTEEITEEGEAMAKRTRQLFAEAKKAKVMEDLTRTGHAPPEFIEQIVDGQQDEVLWARERGGTSAQAAAAQAGAGAADSEDCEETPEGVEAGQRRARADMAKMQVEEDLADAVREQRQAEAEAEAEARCAEAAAMSAEAALQRLKEDAEKAEAAALAARAKAKQTQEALSAIRENFVSKLASIAAAASGKLGEGLAGDKSTGAPFDDLSKFRKESLDALKRNIFQ